MIKLVYDLKAGFDDCYLTIKDDEFDLSQMLELEKLGEVEYAEDIEELEGRTVDFDKLRASIDEEFYNQYKDDMQGLLALLEDSGHFDFLLEDSVLYISKCFFSHLLETDELVPIWEPSNWRLVYDPEKRSDYFYTDAMSAKEVCDLLKLTRQQLHYYVKVGQIRKEYNPDNKQQFRYNRLDVYILQKKLAKKYDRYK